MDEIQLNRQPVSNIPNYEIHTFFAITPTVSRAARTDGRIVLTIYIARVGAEIKISSLSTNIQVNFSHHFYERVQLHEYYFQINTESTARCAKYCIEIIETPKNGGGGGNVDKLC